MPGKDGTGPLGTGPCGKDGRECRRKNQSDEGKDKKKKPGAARARVTDM